MHIESEAFRNGSPIPRKYTRLGQNTVPPLHWTDAPDGTKSYVLKVEDPDVSNAPFVHCIIYNLPAEYSDLEQPMTSGAPKAVFAPNDFGNRQYDGPEPPRGHGPHRYIFRLAALDVPELRIPDDADASEVWRQACIHSLEMSELVGRYEHN